MSLDEDRFHSAYVATMIHNRRYVWLNQYLKKKKFKHGDLVLMYNSKLGKHLGKLKLSYVGPYKIF